MIARKPVETHDKRLPKPGEPGRYIYATAPRCESCGSLKILVYKTLAADSKYVRCGDCNAKFILLLE
jgi:hypothetical protein